MAATVPNEFTTRLHRIADVIDSFDGLGTIDLRERDQCVDELRALADAADDQPWTGTADIDLASVTP